jgi:hypothetical protein
MNNKRQSQCAYTNNGNACCQFDIFALNKFEASPPQ